MEEGDLYRTSTGRRVVIVAADWVETGPSTVVNVIAYRFVGGSGRVFLRSEYMASKWTKIEETP